MNFRKQGRPQKWKPSQRALKQGGKTLSDTNILRNSIAVKMQNNVITAGTPVIYGRIHQFGGRINKTVNVKEHERKITQAYGRRIRQRIVNVASHRRHMDTVIEERPFLMLQREDVKNIIRIAKEEVAAVLR